MTTLDYTRLFDAKPSLGLDFDAPGRILPWLVIDRANGDTTYYKTATLDGALDFVAAQVARGDATAYVEDIEFWRMWRLSLGHSVMGNKAWRVAQAFGTLSERERGSWVSSEASGNTPEESARLVTGGSRKVADPDPALSSRSESVLATVHPFPKMHEATDEASA